MRSTAKLAAAALAGSLAAGTALAQPISGPYISLGVGADIFQDQSVKNYQVPYLGIVANHPGNLNYDVYVGGQGSLGWGLGNGFRVELSGTYARSDVSGISGLRGGSGYTDATAILVNGLYDFDLTPFGVPGLAPYLGAGVGYGIEHLDGPHGSTPGGSYVELGGTRDDVAIDGIAGLAYNIAAIPGLALTAEYRFLTIPESLKFGGFQTAPGLAPAYSREKVGALYAHMGMIGFRYALWQPPPPPPPAPPPPPPPPAVEQARTYLVFFDWDRADLTARARQIVAEAAQASTHVQTTKIEVNGYTDLSGTAAYNQRLSVRRAKSVEAELIRDGVAAGEIEIHGYGESNPLVPTAPGVREPQNRRVEIILK
ncbi:MAG TPA: OmpA family protein [Acetobacteraceae bacterium]|nr:OmpA family protein [Acetobacteraceae bacterium]